MNYVKLSGTNIDNEARKIKHEINENSDIVFVYEGEEIDTLYDYITELSKCAEELNSQYLYKFKICYERTDLRVSLFRDDNTCAKVSTMSAIIAELAREHYYRIVVDNDDREQLAFIVQQLIYIEYPLDKIDILLNKEEKDADKTKRFMENVVELREECNVAIGKLKVLRKSVERENDCKVKEERLKDIDKALESSELILEQINKAMDVELKLAVAASKKAGKSVMVNCIIGEEIAPTSTELATPNNLFYRKSEDGAYHLKYVNETEEKIYERRDDIYREIDSCFREAQNNKEDGFMLPNMEIKYVSDGNNFSTYTIFDTAGPDAAGTEHRTVALEAMKKCDVAIFAIDYAKYLTTSEEEYLEEIKTMFVNQNKFHSLVFALNKIDVRYTDAKSAKSCIMSVDFIKTRLARINEKYRDCIIFPTCSLEYFNAIEAEKAGVEELLPENTLPIEKMKDVKFGHREVPALAWLHTHSENLEYYHGVKEISYDVFKKDSGMPALMSYVSYVAQSKARDEIVNNVAYQIASQKMEIQAVLDYIKNLEIMIHTDEQQIGNITKILDNYKEKVCEILGIKRKNFTQEEKKILEKTKVLEFDRNTSEISYGKLEDELRQSFSENIKASYEDKTIVEMISVKVKNCMWNKLGKKEKVTRQEIDKLFDMNDLKSIVQELLTQQYGESSKDVYDYLDKLRRGLEEIIKKRMEELNHASEECSERLRKENVELLLPQIPEFHFAVELSPPKIDFGDNDSLVNFECFEELKEIFKWTFNWKNIRNLFSLGKEKEVIYRRPEKKSFYEVYDRSLGRSIRLEMYELNIADKLRNAVISDLVDGYMSKILGGFVLQFKNTNKQISSCVDAFKSSVDDRKVYIGEIQLYEQRKKTIMDISENVSGFMSIWKKIIEGIEDIV